MFRDPDWDATPRELYQHMLTQALGPFGGMTFNWANGAQLIGEGRMFEGIERLMPKAGRDLMRAFKYSNEGATSLSGDVLVDDFSTAEITGQVFGIAPARLSEAYDARRIVKGSESAINRRRKLLMAEYYRAYKDNDTRTMGEVRRRIYTFNYQNPAFRISASGLRRSMRERTRRDRTTVGGIYLPDTKQGLLSEARFAF